MGYSRDPDGHIDSGKVILGAVLVGGAVFAFKKLVIDKSATPPSPGYHDEPHGGLNLPPSPSSPDWKPPPPGVYPEPNQPPQPTPGQPAAGMPSWWPSWLPPIPGFTPGGPTPPVPVPPGGIPSLPSSPMGDKAQVGDDVLVSTAALSTILGASSPFQTTAVQMHITEAQPGAPVVTAIMTDAQAQGTPLMNAPFPVPRSAIIGIVKDGPMPKPAPSPAPAPAPAPPPSMPNVPIPSGPLPLVYLPDPMPLVTGMKYRARLDLGPFEGALANEQAIGSQFNALGFTNVKVWKNAFQLPGDWPTETTQNPRSTTWWVEGLYQNPAQTVPKPSQVTMAWVAGVGA